MAVAAAHRISQHSPLTSPRSAISGHLDGDEEHGHGHGHDHDLEAGPSGSPTSRMAHLFSPGGTKPRYRWLSGARGGGTGDEPGVDVRSQRDEEAYGHLTSHSHITVCLTRFRISILTTGVRLTSRRWWIGPTRRMMKRPTLGSIFRGRD